MMKIRRYLPAVKVFITGVVGLLILIPSQAQEDSAGNVQLPSIEEQNKAIARDFYQDLWFTKNTDNYEKYVAEEYTVHDIFDRKGIREDAIEQKKIADFFWENGDINSTLDYQIAQGDMVATRWIMDYEPKTILGNVLLGNEPIAIINVFRVENGKIVEVWNHRHDIETGQTLQFTIKGLLIGLLICLVPTVIAFRLMRKIKALTTT